MKVYGWRHKSNTSFTLLSNEREATNHVLKTLLKSVGVEWDNRHKHFEEIEAELSYEDEGF